MKLLIAIAPILIVGVVGYFVISIQEWIADVRFYRQRTKKELDRIRRSLGEVECAKHTLPTGEVEILGPGTIIFEEEMADEVIKEARERRVGDIG